MSRTVKAIGDVHGRLDVLLAALQQAGLTVAADTATSIYGLVNWNDNIQNTTLIVMGGAIDIRALKSDTAYRALVWSSQHHQTIPLITSSSTEIPMESELILRVLLHLHETAGVGNRNNQIVFLWSNHEVFTMAYGGRPIYLSSEFSQFHELSIDHETLSEDYLFEIASQVSGSCVKQLRCVDTGVSTGSGTATNSSAGIVDPYRGPQLPIVAAGNYDVAVHRIAFTPHLVTLLTDCLPFSSASWSIGEFTFSHSGPARLGLLAQQGIGTHVTAARCDESTIILDTNQTLNTCASNIGVRLFGVTIDITNQTQTTNTDDVPMSSAFIITQPLQEQLGCVVVARTSRSAAATNGYSDNWESVQFKNKVLMHVDTDDILPAA